MPASSWHLQPPSLGRCAGNRFGERKCGGVQLCHFAMERQAEGVRCVGAGVCTNLTAYLRLHCEQPALFPSFAEKSFGNAQYGSSCRHAAFRRACRGCGYTAIARRHFYSHSPLPRSRRLYSHGEGTKSVLPKSNIGFQQTARHAPAQSDCFRPKRHRYASRFANGNIRQHRRVFGAISLAYSRFVSLGEVNYIFEIQIPIVRPSLIL